MRLFGKEAKAAEGTVETTSQVLAKAHVAKQAGKTDVEHFTANNPLLEDIAKAHDLPSPKEQVQKALPGMKIARGKQEAGYAAERTARAAKVNAIYHDTSLTVAQRQALAKSALSGELPKINYKGFKGLTPEALDAMKQDVMTNEGLLPLQKTRIVDALDKAAAGKVPTTSELRDLEMHFGRTTAQGLVQVATTRAKSCCFSSSTRLAR